MNDPQPPPLPSSDSHRDPGAVTPPKAGEDQVYTLFEQKIGGVPNLRKKDNLYQGIAVAVCLLLGATIGWQVEGEGLGAILGALIGTFTGLILSGVVLMILGWTRKT